MCQVMAAMARFKKMTSLALDPELMQRLEEWIAKQEFPPSKTAVFEAALLEFLDRRERKRC